MKERILTALGTAPIVLGMLAWSQPWGVGAIGLAITLLGAREIARMIQFPVWLLAPIALTLFLLGSVNPFQLERPILTGLGVLLFVIGLAAAYLARPNTRWHPFALLSGAWVAIPMASLVQIHEVARPSAVLSLQNLVFIIILPIWAGDSAAIFAGRSLGRTPMMPSISPNKTWEGAVANLFACVGVAAALGHWMGLDLWLAVSCGLAAGVLGQAGDLFESAIKRHAGLKDSGSLLPGHGGIMDRVDSILFTAPAITALILLLANR